jgi:hypothetical protein
MQGGGGGGRKGRENKEERGGGVVYSDMSECGACDTESVCVIIVYAACGPVLT